MKDQITKDLEKIKEDINNLSREVESTSGDLKGDLGALLGTLDNKWLDLKTSIEKASGAALAQVKSTSQKSLQELRDSLNQARQRLSDKIAPN